ncbi:hypothetical protein AMAG_01159 [Allomyces macrogynus ATCC 38327]|uniref:Response regulatory domain-containing protein n=1 Tax=Allomyces macrogynus (strain ATCC 38327) TaxID=578462 RepID=A0A0L0RYV6_ALLM3|nr:hypothetical protein AMAG_01159 [Allomyces macrogynus ATCC 38327]|eukprot:KNE55246.1 hypothetical protein AMAG_01159 [Allomyces macrogynus ATCC 38327]
MDSVVSTSSLGGSTMGVQKVPAHAVRRRTVPPPLSLSSPGKSALTPSAPTPEKPAPATPAAAAAPRRAATTASVPLAARVLPRVRVLVVEDNAINQRILTTFLRQRGVAHCAASTGADAVAQFATWVPPLVLMDLQLAGGMDGLEATRQMRAVESAASEGGPRSPRAVIVALSAGAAATNRRAALAAGCDDYVEKPVNLKWLERRMVEWACMQAILGYGAMGGRRTSGGAVLVDEHGDVEKHMGAEGRMAEGTREAGASVAPD